MIKCSEWFYRLCFIKKVKLRFKLYNIKEINFDSFVIASIVYTLSKGEYMKILMIFVVLLLVSCDKDTTQNKKSSIALGKITFANNCATCHGDKAQSTVEDWRKPLPNGSYPAPPLNGTAHTWHHSPASLLGTINNGGKEFGGWMPAFKEKLSSDEKEALIDYIYDLWPQEIKEQYDKRFK